MAVPEAVETRIRDAPVSAHLATSVGDRPHVAPVWYGYRDGVLYVITGGQKLANVRANDRVSLSIESVEEGVVEWTVTLLGRATVVEDRERIEWAEGWIYDRYPGGDDVDVEESEAGEGAEDEAESDDPDLEYALLEIAIGSASLSTYD